MDSLPEAHGELQRHFAALLGIRHLPERNIDIVKRNCSFLPVVNREFISHLVREKRLRRLAFGRLSYDCR